MYQIGVINQGVEEEIVAPYSKGLQRLGIAVTLLDEEDREEVLTKQGILIFTDSTHVIRSCSLICQLRAQTDTRIWVYQQQATNAERLLYLQLGIDGNLLPECSSEESCWWMKNTLERKKRKRGYNRSKRTKESLTYPPRKKEHEIILDNTNQRVIIENKKIDLTRMEYQLFDLLYSDRGETYTYKDIYSALWKETFVQPKQYKVANIIFHLRTKLKQHAINPMIIKTVRSVGYRFQ